jgi:hypothetical protein
MDEIRMVSVLDHANATLFVFCAADLELDILDKTIAPEEAEKLLEVRRAVNSAAPPLLRILAGCWPRCRSGALTATQRSIDYRSRVKRKCKSVTLRNCDMSRLFSLNYFEFPPMEGDSPGLPPIAAFNC